MKIVILGGGISGLSVYLFLQKHLPKPSPPAKPHEILIYEAYDTTRGLHSKDAGSAYIPKPQTDYDQTANSIAIGGGLGILGNGLNVLKRLDEDIFHDIVRNGHPLTNFKFSNSRGWTLLNQPLQTENGMTGVLVGRQAFWACIRDKVPDEAIVTKKVAAVVANVGNQRNVVQFVDGSPDVEADLIIGADGLRSIARKAVLGSDEKVDFHSPHYEGLVGVGGLVPSSVLKQTGVADGELSLVFGSVGFFGYGYMTSSPDAVDRHLPYKPVEPGPYAVWWSTFELEKCPDWRSLDKEDAQRQLVERHSSWKNPTIQKIVESVKVDRMWPSWTIPPLPTWERNGVVLVGDAAHALQSTSGQGASQALEDSESFALLLGHYMRWAYRHPKATQVESEGEAQELAAKKFEDLRMPHVQMIYDRSQMTANSKKRLPVWKEFLVYFMLWLVGVFKFNDAYNNKVLNYNTLEEVQRIVK